MVGPVELTGRAVLTSVLGPEGASGFACVCVTIGSFPPVGPRVGTGREARGVTVFETGLLPVASILAADCVDAGFWVDEGILRDALAVGGVDVDGLGGEETGVREGVRVCRGFRGGL